MGRGAGSIRERKGKIQISFTHGGKRLRRNLDLEWGPRNCKAALRMLDEITERIKNGTFNAVDFFDGDSAAPAAETFGVYAQLWLDSLTHLATSTRQDYRKQVRRIWLPVFGNRDIATVRYSDIVGALNDTATYGKTRNNILIPLRQIFAFAKTDGAIDKNPAEAIANAKVQVKQPDPFSLDEVEAILCDLYTHEPEPIGNYFTAAFFAGFRPSEQIALTWADVDANRKTVRVQRATVRGKPKDSTKTHTSRDVELTSRAWEAFERQKKHTRLAGKQVFNNPGLKTGAWTDVQVQRKRWITCLSRLKMRYREPYQTRHTFASQALMAGANPSWVARQLGHANTGMLFKKYARWLSDQDAGRERGKLDAAFGAKQREAK